MFECSEIHTAIVPVPPGGFGSQLDMMHGWLNMHAGRRNFAMRSAQQHLYFVDIKIARAFVERFA